MSQLNKEVDVAIRMVQAVTDCQYKTERQQDVSYIHMNESYEIAILCC